MSGKTQKPTILQAAQAFLEGVRLSRSRQTHKAYRIGLDRFLAFLVETHGMDPAQTSASQLENTHAVAFVESVRAEQMSAATQRLYATAVRQFYLELVSSGQLQANLVNLNQQIGHKLKKTGPRNPPFPRDEIEKLLDYAQALGQATSEAPRQRLSLRSRLRLINLRDRAFALTLADTGLRVHEACALRRGDLDWYAGKAGVVGKGDYEATVRFSGRALAALKAYLEARQSLDNAAGRQESALPLFARHDKGAGKQVKPITTETGRDIVKRLVRESLGEGALKRITPHSFRHYFVSIVMLATEGDIQVTQKLARHRHPGTTMRYAHLADGELDQAYRKVFDEELEPPI